MSEIEIIEVKMHGIEAKGTVKQIAELKKMLDAQYPIIKYIPQTYPYPWTTPYWQQPYYSITCDTTGMTSKGGGITIQASSGVFSGTLSTSTDANTISCNGSLIQNLHLTN